MTLAQTWLAPAFALAAFLYSSVGHGGASAYLALGTLAGFARGELVPMALLLNVVVAGTSLWSFRKHLRVELLVPLVAASIPAAFVGAKMPLSNAAFAGLLGAALLWSGARLSFRRTFGAEFADAPLAPMSRARAWIWAPLCGLGIGLLSGMLGIGGGVFLSPIVLLLRWANVKQTAAVSAAFIVANSLSGLASYAHSGSAPSTAMIPFVVAAIAGGILGSHVGSTKLSSRGLATMLGGILLLAGTKLVLTAVH